MPKPGRLSGNSRGLIRLEVRKQEHRRQGGPDPVGRQRRNPVEAADDAAAHEEVHGDEPGDRQQADHHVAADPVAHEAAPAGPDLPADRQRRQRGRDQPQGSDAQHVQRRDGADRIGRPSRTVRPPVIEGHGGARGIERQSDEPAQGDHDRAGEQCVGPGLLPVLHLHGRQREQEARQDPGSWAAHQPPGAAQDRAGEGAEQRRGRPDDGLAGAERRHPGGQDEVARQLVVAQRIGDELDQRPRRPLQGRDLVHPIGLGRYAVQPGEQRYDENSDIEGPPPSPNARTGLGLTSHEGRIGKDHRCPGSLERVPSR